MTLFPAITGTAAIAAEVAAVPVIVVLRPDAADAALIPAQGTNAPAGTAPCTVGTGDSCQPTPTFSASTPAATSAAANASTSSHGRDSGISSAPVIRKSTGKSVADRLAHRGRDLDPEPHPPLRVAAPRSRRGGS